MTTIRLLVCSALVGLLPLNSFAQRLLWEVAFVRPSTAGGTALGNISLLPGNRVLVNGDFFPTRTSGCQPNIRALARIYTLGGVLVREQLGRGLQNGESSVVPAPGGGGWWAGRGYQCPAGATTAQQRPYAQRLTAAGDTLPGWWLAPAAPRATTTASLLQGNRLMTVGMVSPAGTPAPGQQFSLTCSDTLGRVRWTRAYPRQTGGLDYASNLVATPRGGYLLNGEAYVSTGYRPYLAETDSGGRLRRQVLLQPLGPAVTNGSRYTRHCNMLTLPNAQGYLLAGTADSVAAGQLPPGKEIAYVVRLDTALNVQWVYRHPAALSGTGAISTQAYRLNFLPNNSVGLLLAEVRGPGTPTAYLVQVDIATGRRVGYYPLSSNTQAVVLPGDWQWVGDGTLLLCAKSFQAGVTYSQGYVARWDFRGTPLAARTAGEAAALATFALYPNPTTGPPTLAWQLPPGTRAGQLHLYDPLGRLVQALALPATATGTLAVPGLAPGLYVAHLLDADGQRQGGARKLVVD